MRINSLLLGCAIAALLPAAALAQPAPEGTGAGQDEASVVDDVIVTARKREERLFDVPVAVTAVTSDTIEARQLTSVRDVATITPGLNINSDAAGRAFISIRGIGTTLLDSVQPGVGIFVDGIYQANTSYLNSPTLDVEQIEVLRGPQSTLFGQNTLGGAINVTTRQPTDTVEGQLTGTFAGPDDYYIVGGTIAGPLPIEHVSGRLSAGIQSRDGFIRNSLLGIDDANPLDQRSVRGSLRIELPREAVLTVGAYFDSVDGTGPLYALTPGPRIYNDDSQLNLRSQASYEYMGANAKLVVPVSESTDMTGIVSYDRRDATLYGDGDYQPISLFISGGDNILETTTGELRFDTEWSDSFSTLFGVFASNQSTEASTFNILIPLNLTIPARAESNADLWAVFGNIFWDIAPGLELSAGLRYDSQDIDYLSNGFVSHYEAQEWQPRVAITKSWTDDFMTYASIARGFRGGGVNGPGAPNPVYKGDSVWTYELGTKFKAFDRRLTAQAAVFFNDYSDFIGQNSLAPSTAGPGFVGVNLNTGDAESYGFEVEFTARLTEHWTVGGAASIQRARITDDSQYTAVTGRFLPSDRIPFVPDYNFSFQTNYTVPLGDMGDLDFNASLVGKGDRVGASLSNTFSPVLDDYLLTNASITWTYDRYQLAVFANNLFDEEYYDSYIDSSVLTVAGLPALGSLGLMGDGRRVGVRGRVRF